MGNSGSGADGVGSAAQTGANEASGCSQGRLLSSALAPDPLPANSVCKLKLFSIRLSSSLICAGHRSVPVGFAESHPRVERCGRQCVHPSRGFPLGSHRVPRVPLGGLDWTEGLSGREALRGTRLRAQATPGPGGARGQCCLPRRRHQELKWQVRISSRTCGRGPLAARWEQPPPCGPESPWRTSCLVRYSFPPLLKMKPWAARETAPPDL